MVYSDNIFNTSMEFRTILKSFVLGSVFCHHSQGTYTTPTRLELHSRHAASRTKTPNNHSKTWLVHTGNIFNTWTKFWRIMKSFILWSVFCHHSQGTYTTPTRLELHSRHAASRINTAENHSKKWMEHSDNIFHTCTKFWTIFKSFVLWSVFYHHS